MPADLNQDGPSLGLCQTKAVHNCTHFKICKCASGYLHALHCMTYVQNICFAINYMSKVLRRSLQTRQAQIEVANSATVDALLGRESPSPALVARAAGRC